MDSLTHLVAGALTPVAFRGSPRRAAVIAFGIAAGELPDIDVIFGSGAEALLVLHRGVTHALFWQPVMALALVIPFYIWLCSRNVQCPDAAHAVIGAAPCCPRRAGRADVTGGPGFGFGRMWLIALFALCVHIYLDCMTTFGTMILLPFSAVRAGFPALFIVDLMLTLPLLALLATALRQPGAPGRGGTSVFSDRARRFALAGLAWTLLYPMLALGVNQAATALLGPAITARVATQYSALYEPDAASVPDVGGIGDIGDAGNAVPRFESGRFFLLTEPFAPFVWKGVIDQGDSWRMDVVSLRDPGAARFGTVYAKPEPLLYESLKRQLPLFAWFEDFAPYMTQTEREPSPLVRSGYREPIREYAFSDLRYIMPEASFARRVGQSGPLFVLEARVNDTGALVAYRFLEDGGDDAPAVPWTVLE